MNVFYAKHARDKEGVEYRVSEVVLGDGTLKQAIIFQKDKITKMLNMFYYSNIIICA